MQVFHLLVVVGLVLLLSQEAHCLPSASGAIIVDHHCINIDKIPHSAIENAKKNLHIAYGHTSHGSQLIAGMTGLDNFLHNSPKYKTPMGPAE